MHEQEGVIKFQLDYRPTPPYANVEAFELCAWREVLVRLGMVGQDATRYGGLGFGNISCRATHHDDANAFLISGTQTGGVAALGPEHVATVLACYPQQNRVVAEGPIRPSSEAMTHGVLYALSPDINWVLHGHDPTIWRAAERLGLPRTRRDVPYGSPQMADEVARLFRESAVAQTHLFTMDGHEDGVVAFGATAQEAMGVLVENLMSAYRFPPPPQTQHR